MPDITSILVRSPLKTGTENTMNKKLLELYSSKWHQYVARIKPFLDKTANEVVPANPLLLYIHDEDAYQNADIRLMVFGQETNSWYDEKKVTIEGIQNLYKGFFCEGKCWSYGGHFWNGVNRFLLMLQEKFPGKKIELIWNNIVKVGRQGDKGFPSAEIYEIERKFFQVIPGELNILKPDIALFLTGPNYDSIMEDNFGKMMQKKVSSFQQRELSKLELLGVPYVFRTYHPNYLFRNDINRYFSKIIDQIKF